MYIIAGLGNPTGKYEHTRHNVGFDAIDVIAQKYKINISEKKHKAVIGRGIIGLEKVLLVKPMTYMNLSGESIGEIADYFKIPPENIIILCDDVNLDPGQIRIRSKGSAGGQNGLKNIIMHLGSDAFPRIRVGTGEKPEDWDLADYVLSRPQGEDKEKIQEAFKDVAEAVEIMLTDDIQAAMNRFNKKKTKKIKEELNEEKAE